MKTLKQLTDELKAAGFVDVRMDKAWKRKDHREALIVGRMDFDDPKLKGKSKIVEQALVPFKVDLYPGEGCAPTVWQVTPTRYAFDMTVKIELPEEW